MDGQTWLLLGGPAHGVVHEVFFSTKVVWEHEGRDYTYLPEVYTAEDGQSYIVGLFVTPVGEVEYLVKKHKVRPIIWEEQKAPKRLT